MWILCEVTNFAEEGQHCGRGQWEWVDGVDRCQKKLRKSKREKTLLLLSSSIKVVKEIKQNQTITHYQWITELLFTPAKSRKDVFLLHPLRIKGSFLIWVSSALYKKFVSLYLSFILSCEQVKPHYCMEFERALCSGPGLGYFFSIKSGIINISGFRGHWHSLLYLLNSAIVARSSHGQYVNLWVWRCVIKLLETKIFGH